MRTIKTPFGFIAKFLAEPESSLEELCLAAASRLSVLYLFLGSIVLYFLALTQEGASEFLVSLSPGRGLSSVV